MEELKKLLSALGITEAQIAPLVNEEKPEGFDAGAAIKSIVADRESFYKTKLAPVIQNEYEESVKAERYAAAVKPIQNRLAKIATNLNVPADQLKDLDAKALADLIAEKQSEAITAATKEGDQELRAQVNEFKTKLSEVQAKLSETVAQKEAEIQAVREQTAKERKAEKIDQRLRAMLSSDKFKDIKSVGQLEDIVKLYVDKAGFALDLTDTGDLKPLAKDGTAAINSEANILYQSAEDMVLDVARRNNLFPVHNGGEGTGKTLSTERIINGEKKIVGSNANWLKEQMGV